MARFGQQDADRIADVLERVAAKARPGHDHQGRPVPSQLMQFLAKAGARAANGLPSGQPGTGGDSQSTTTEGAAITNLRSSALIAWAGLLDAVRLLHAFEHELFEVLREETNTERANTVDICAGCSRVITGIGNDRPRRIDGQPYCDACRKRHERAS
jgi:hypothetical protein